MGQVCEIKDQAGNSEYFYYDNEGNLTKHVDRNQNHVDRIYNLDRNIVSVKAYQVDEEAIAIEAKKAEEARTKAIEKAKINNEEGFITTPLSQKHRRRSFTERQKEKQEKQKTEVLEENNSKIEITDDPNKNKLEVIDQRFNYNSDGTLKSAYTGNMQIVPHKQASAAAEKLERLGINRNSSANGVRLPSIEIKGNPQTIHSARFSGKMYHGLEYIDMINEGIDNVNSYDEAMEFLNSVRRGLLDGSIDVYE